MDVLKFLHLSAAILVAAAFFGFLNYKYLRLPHTIGLVVIALAASLFVVGVDAGFGTGFGPALRQSLLEIDFQDTLLLGMLSFLLFAGALHVDLNALLSRKWEITTLATVGVVLSTAVAGGLTYLILGWLEMPVPLIWCLVFGSLISPTDPVAVMGVLKTVHVPPALEAKIAGESLFNDGIGVVLFAVLLSIAVQGPENVGAADVALLFAEEVPVGILLGLAGGYLAFVALRQLDEHNLEVLITLALVVGLYSISQLVHASGPLAVVVAGLLIGNHGRRLAMSETTRRHVTAFWSLVDEILNSVLFLIIGFEVLVIGFHGGIWMAIGATIIVVLFARATAVGVPMWLLSMRGERTKGAVPVLIWGGLRGGISVALALSLPQIAARETLLALTYGVVIFSIIVQGLTIEHVIRRATRSE